MILSFGDKETEQLWVGALSAPLTVIGSWLMVVLNAEVLLCIAQYVSHYE